jgi:hypothetical protein
LFSINPIVYNGWIYYAIPEEGISGIVQNDIYRIRTDGTRNTLISDNAVYFDWLMGEFFIVEGEWIYFLSATDDETILINRMRVNGSERQTIIWDDVRCFNIFDGWIYYSNYSSYPQGSLYRVRTDGSQRERINNEPVFNISVINGWIYYNDGEWLGHYYRAYNRVPLIRVRMDGTDREVLWQR